MDFFYRPPKFLKLIFPDIIWENEEDKILLTIDDGPSDNTMRILDSLDRFGIKAIFFCTGKNIEKYFNEFNAIIKSGHIIQNHGYEHKRMILRNRKKNFEDIDRSCQVIRELTGNTPVLYRPPYGLFNLHTLQAVRKNGMQMMLWSLLTGDHTGDFAAVRRITNSYLERNTILVMHDNRKASVVFDQSLEHIVNLAEERHFDFSLTELKTSRDKK